MEKHQQKQSGKNTFQSPDEVPSSVIEQLDAILVLGGGVPSTPNDPPPYVKARCQSAAQVYHRHQNQNQHERRTPPKIITLSAGTAHLPQLLSEDGLPVWESTASASYLMKEMNVPPSDIYAETTSYDTISNAFFTRTNFCDLSQWKKILIITSEFHMMRTRVIFDWVMNVPSPQSDSDDISGYDLYYLSVPDEGLTEEAVRIRNEKEYRSAMNVRKHLSPKYDTLEKVFQFITGEHAFYNAEKLVERANTKTDGGDGAKELEILRQTYGGANSSKPANHPRLGGGGGEMVGDGRSFFLGVLFGSVLAGSLFLLLGNKAFGRDSKSFKAK